MYMFVLPNLKIYMYTPWVICLSCTSIYMDSIVFRDMYVYLLCWLFIHIPWNEILFWWKFSFSWFRVYLFNFMYMSILSKLLDIHVYPFWATCLHAYILVDSLCFGYVCILLGLSKHTYALKYIFFLVLTTFMFSMFICLTSCICLSCLNY